MLAITEKVAAEAATTSAHAEIPGYDEELERLREQAKATYAKAKETATGIKT